VAGGSWVALGARRWCGVDSCPSVLGTLRGEEEEWDEEEERGGQVREALAGRCLPQISGFVGNRSGVRSPCGTSNNKGVKDENRFFIRQEFASGQFVSGWVFVP